MIEERLCYVNFVENNQLVEWEVIYRISNSDENDSDLDEDLDVVVSNVFNDDVDVLPLLDKSDIEELEDLCREDYFSGEWEYADE